MLLPKAQGSPNKTLDCSAIVNAFIVQEVIQLC